MALEPITRKEKIIAGQDLTPITRLEKFLKNFGGGGGGSVPKPLTYDYMPEGYPSKGVVTVTLMEEQEVAFSEKNGLMVAPTPVDLDIKPGDKLTVVWDGVSYDVIVKIVNIGSLVYLAFGNLSLADLGDTEDYPFACVPKKRVWFAADTATSHTIGVGRQQATYTPIDMNFIPKNLNVVFIAETGSIPTSYNVTYDELRGWVENNIPVLSIYRRIDSNYVEIITTINLESDSLVIRTVNSGFVYNSDGTFSELQQS